LRMTCVCRKVWTATRDERSVNVERVNESRDAQTRSDQCRKRPRRWGRVPMAGGGWLVTYQHDLSGSAALEIDTL